MSDTVIAVENLGKKYLIGHQRMQRYTALRDVVADNVKEAGRRVLRRGNASMPTREEIWALKDVSFEVKRGERLGIIGRNGAGKSTLLKILSRITEPTTGRVRLRGRVASLLEVGTGFHPELTGRENIYLNGAILGMSRVEIQRKFDEIVAFAEVEKFLDTPVKRYSSGMYVRLAFAVAAHLEPEILLVDEVLAVGDAEFQKKCLGKMEGVGRDGRTVLFVSHNMGAVKQLCPLSIFLHEGRVQRIGSTNEVVGEYISQGVAEQSSVVWRETDPYIGDNFLRLQSLALKNQAGETVSDFDFLEPITIELRYQVFEAARIRLVFQVCNDDGVDIFVSNDSEVVDEPSVKRPGEYISTATIPGHLLNSDVYLVTVVAGIPNFKQIAKQENVLSFRVHATSGIAARRDGVYGLICPPIQWTTGVEEG